MRCSSLRVVGYLPVEVQRAYTWGLTNMFRRSSRPADAGASSGGDLIAHVASVATADNVDTLEEQLRRIEDEEAWRKSHTRLILQYNASSVAFWLLMIASLSFAALNAFYGYQGATADQVAGTIAYSAWVIAFLYATIELTVPVSAHLVSWEGQGAAKWAIRVIGTLAFGIGVGFSLLILQGKFASGADSAGARSEIVADALAGDRTSLTELQSQRAELARSVGVRDARSFETEVATILATPIGRKTLADTTDECSGTRKSATEREKCAQVDSLRRKVADAKTLAGLDERIATVRASLTGAVDKGQVARTANVQDKVISTITGWNMESIRLLKASFIAMMAALITHMLWAAHGMTVNAAISKRRDEMMRKNALKRAVDRHHAHEARAAEQTAAKFTALSGATKRVAAAIEAAPLLEQPAVLQVQRFFTERALLGEQFMCPISLAHDEYLTWARTNGVASMPIDRFAIVLEHAGLGVTRDGKIVGATMKGNS